MKEMNYKEKYENLIEQLKKEKEEHGGYTFSSVIDKIVPEFHESKDEKMWKLIKKYAHSNISDIVLNADHITRKELEDWLEKQGKKKPTDKVEPKFMVGDWIVSPNGVYWHIDTIRDGRYQVSSNSGKCAEWPLDTNIYHRFTIQDAKDGDVLANEEMIVIFKHFEEPSYRQHIVAYIGLDTSGNIQITDETWTLGIDKAKPATKEQRDLLFQKMEEAGYTWDAEKKDLKKIEQKSSWSEKDESMLTRCIGILGKCYMKELPNKVEEELIWLKSIKSKIQPNKEWSIEDNERLTRIHQFIWANRKGDTDEIYQQEQDADWLMTLKPQPKQEWSEEDSEWYMIVKESILERWKGTDNKDLIEIRDGALEWLNKVQPQPKQEWSEVNDSMIEGIKIAILNYYDKENAEEIINWLKSLKPHWKPSEEQMETLKFAANDYVMGETKKNLESLYNDLKKL